MTREPLVLGIESSCDETGIGIVRGTTLLANEVASSMDLHVRFGGVVPEIASRAHLEAMLPALGRACDTAGIRLKDVDAIAVTVGPGLAGALMVGVAAAKALSIALDKPLYGVNHLAAHVAADMLDHGPLPEPTMGLLVSGGHTNLLYVPDIARDVRSLGNTIDDACGEAFDKVARVLGLPYPGGPNIDRAAQGGDRKAIHFPRGLSTKKDLEKHRYDFSFSGLKTAVTRWVATAEAEGREVPVADVAASFQEAVVDVITKKAVMACRDYECNNLMVGGGVSANSRLRQLLEDRCSAAGISIRVPKLTLCTDNGAMVAALGSHLVAEGMPPSTLDVPAESSMSIEQVQG